MARSPLETVKEKFGSKEDLVSSVRKLASKDLWLDRVRDAGLDRISNAKLLRLHGLLEKVKSEFGSRDKLIEAIRTLENRIKDEGYKASLEKSPLPRLWDKYTSLKKKKSA